jgi:hypothetical protein
MIGKYQRKDGTKFDVIYSAKEGYQRCDEKKFGYRLFAPITEEVLNKELESKEIKKL